MRGRGDGEFMLHAEKSGGPRSSTLPRLELEAGFGMALVLVCVAILVLVLKYCVSPSKRPVVVRSFSSCILVSCLDILNISFLCLCFHFQLSDFGFGMHSTGRHRRPLAACGFSEGGGTLEGGARRFSFTTSVLNLKV